MPLASAAALAPPPSSPAPTGPDLSLFVRSDSVVATATLRYSGALPAVILAWGDGTTSRPSPPNVSLPGQPVPSAGSVVFQHAYEANGGALTKRVSVLSALTGRELVAANVVILPRYRVTQQAIEFSPLNHCDSVLEETTEWEVFTDGGLPPEGRQGRLRVTRRSLALALSDERVVAPSRACVRARRTPRRRRLR